MTWSGSKDFLTTVVNRILSNVLLRNISGSRFECIEELLTTWVSTHLNEVDLPTLPYITENHLPAKRKQLTHSSKENMEKMTFGATQENGGGTTTNNSNLSSLTNSKDLSSNGDSS